MEVFPASAVCVSPGIRPPTGLVLDGENIFDKGLQALTDLRNPSAHIYLQEVCRGSTANEAKRLEAEAD
jgi:hypothetical protein